GLDLLGAVVLGIVTALGGGTVRDLLIRAPIFWFQDMNYIWMALAGALLAFWGSRLLRSTANLLLYLDGLGAALFAISGANKALVLNHPGPVAVMMGVLTGIGGGLVSDVLAGRPTLLMSRDIYATPILFGCVVFVVLRHEALSFITAGLIGFCVIYGLRALAIHFHLEMPSWLTHHDPDDPE